MMTNIGQTPADGTAKITNTMVKSVTQIVERSETKQRPYGASSKLVEQLYSLLLIKDLQWGTGSTLQAT